MAKSRFSTLRSHPPRALPVVGRPGILFQCAAGHAGSLTLGQHVGLPLTETVKGFPSPVKAGKRKPVVSTGLTPSPIVPMEDGVPYSGSQSKKLTRDPNFIRAWVSGVLLVKLEKPQKLHTDIRDCFDPFNGGWYILRMCPNLRAARYIAGLGMTKPRNVMSIWGRHLRCLAADTPNQLSWLRSSWRLPWPCQDSLLHRNNPEAKLQEWLEETSKSRKILDSVIRTSVHAKHGSMA
jgi:hypothetical protein